MEKLDTSTGRWVPVGRSTEPEMEVRGLQEGHEYQFRVKAINEEGESEPLDTESATLAKNPYGMYLMLYIFSLRLIYYFIDLTLKHLYFDQFFLI